MLIKYERIGKKIATGGVAGAKKTTQLSFIFSFYNSALASSSAPKAAVLELGMSIKK